MSNTEQYRQSVKRKIKAGVYPRFAWVELKCPKEILGAYASGQRHSLNKWKRRNCVTTFGAFRDGKGNIVRSLRFMVLRSTLRNLCGDD